MVRKSLFNIVQTDSLSKSSRGGHKSRSHGSLRDRGSHKDQGSWGRIRGRSSRANYSNARCHHCQKKGHIANFCIKLALIPKIDNESSKTQRPMILGAVTPCQIGDLIKNEIS